MSDSQVDVSGGVELVAVVAVATPEDARLVAMWLHGRPSTTAAKYADSIRRFQRAVWKPLALVTLEDLQAYADTLAHLSPVTQRLHLAAVKSLLGFGSKLRVLPFDVGAALRLPARGQGVTAERILEPDQVRDMIRLEPELRRRVAMGLLYYGGFRIGELLGLRWRDVVARGEAGQVTVLGKGSKARSVLLPAKVWPALVEWRELTAARWGRDGLVFPSEADPSRPVDQTTVRHWVKAAAARAGLEVRPSPHWFRHSHATHALANPACDIALVSKTLGHSSIAITGVYLHVRPNTSSGTYL